MPAKTFEFGWVAEWQGRRGILMIPGTEAWFFVRGDNMEPDAYEVPVRHDEEVAFQWMHQGARMLVSRCIRLSHKALPLEWSRSTEPFGILLDGRYWEGDLAVALQSASVDHPVAVAFLDMNGLKEINDTYGHSPGNDAIKLFLGLVRDATKGVGEAYRVGGDEVLVIMRSTSLERAKTRLVALLEGLGLTTFLDGQVLTASVGVTISTNPEELAKDVGKRADEVQYLAKRASKAEGVPRVSFIAVDRCEPEPAGLDPLTRLVDRFSPEERAAFLRGFHSRDSHLVARAPSLFSGVAADLCPSALYSRLVADGILDQHGDKSDSTFSLTNKGKRFRLLMKKSAPIK